ISGVGVTRGYWGRPGLTADRFVPDPLATRPGDRMYRTGDMGCLLPGGRLEYCGRRDDQVKVRGFRIELGEIEAALLRHPGVETAAAVVAGQDADRRLIAFAARGPSSGLDESELRDPLRRLLPPHAVPSLVVLRDTLPLTPNGKVDRAALLDGELGRHRTPE